MHVLIGVLMESDFFKFPHLQKSVYGQRAVRMQSVCSCVCQNGQSGNQHKQAEAFEGDGGYFSQWGYLII